MTGPLIRTAATAIAASHCLLARMATTPQSIERGSHPAECALCGYTDTELAAAVEDFWEWSGSAHAVEVWEATPGTVQMRRLAEAQGYRETRTIGPEEA